MEKFSRVFCKKIFNKMMKGYLFHRVFTASFSSKLELQRILKAKEEIRENLVMELKFSKENSKRFENLDEFLNNTGFKLTEIPESSDMILSRKDEKTSHFIEIHFRARSKDFEIDSKNDEEAMKNDDSETKKDFIEEQQEELFKEYDDDKGSLETCDFTVFINADNMDGTLYFECYSVEGEINIRNTAVIHDVEKFKSLNKQNRAAFFYQGPEFEHLDNRLQKSFREYLAGFGINAEFATFVESFSLDKDIKLYEDWLRKVDKFMC